MAAWRFGLFAFVIASPLLATGTACGDPTCDDKYVGYEISPAKPDCLAVVEMRPRPSAECHEPLRAQWEFKNNCAKPVTSTDLASLGTTSLALETGQRSFVKTNAGYTRPLAFSVGGDSFTLKILYEE